MRRVLGVRPVAEAVCRVRVEITASLPALGSPAGNTLNNASWHLTVAGPAGTSPASTDSLAVGALSTPDAFTISSPNPAAGPPNSAVTLSCSTCTNTFDGVNSVKFNGTAATVVSVSADGKTINTQVPAGATSGAVSVTNAAGTRTGPSFTVFALPKVSTFTPSSSFFGGPTVSITGFNFFLAGHTTTVTFNGSTHPVTVPNPATITAGSPINGVVVPSDASTGPITVTVSDVGSGVSATSFTFVQVPTITTFTPQVGKSGTVVTVTGTNFVGSMTGRFVFGASSVTAPVTVVSPTQLKITAPAAPTGQTSANLIVHNSAGDSVASADDFAYPGSPTITSVDKTHGPANSQKTTKVTITGTKLDGETAVNFGTKPGTVLSATDTQIVVFAPNGATTGPVTVVTPAGTSNGVTFTVDPLPTIASFTPAAPAGADPGGTVTITGTNFILATGPTVDGVSVNGTPAASFVVNSATKITATLPAANSGISSGPITVTSSAVGSATSAASLIVRATPTVSSFLPASGIVGTKVTVFGTNFAGGGITVTFNGDDPSVSGTGAKTATATVLSNTSLTVNVPAGASSGSITVNSATQGSSDNSTDEFFVAIKPVFSPGAFTGDTNNPFDPTSGPASAQASTIVSIHGAHMFGVTNVLFNNKPAAFVSIQDDNGIAAMVPAGATTGKITLVSPAGNTISSGNFTVDAPPSVTTISPSKGAVGDTVTINGNGFIGEMGGDDCGCTDFGTSVDFHGVFNADITGTMTSQVMNVTVPDGAVTGPLLVTDVWGQTALTPQFTVFQPPVIDQFFNEFTNLRSGKKGQPVVIDGAGFTGTTSVKVNGTPASFVVVRDFEIIATVPAGATTGPITVTNPADTATTAPTNFTVN